MDVQLQINARCCTEVIKVSHSTNCALKVEEVTIAGLKMAQNAALQGSGHCAIFLPVDPVFGQSGSHLQIWVELRSEIGQWL